ncbi:MAG: hypothetical protein ACRC1J_07860, partial [Sandaracinobacteroides sp.]
MAAYIYQTATVPFADAEDAVGLNNGTFVTATVRRVDLPFAERQSFLDLNYYSASGSLLRSVTVDSIVESVALVSYGSVDLEMLADGSVAVAYTKAKPPTDQSDVQIERFSANGLQIGGIILPDTFDPPANATGTLLTFGESSPELSSRADGGFDVTWRDSYAYTGVGANIIRFEDISSRSYSAFGIATTGETAGAFRPGPESVVLTDGSSLSFNSTFDPTITLRDATGQQQGIAFKLAGAGFTNADEAFALPGNGIGLIGFDLNLLQATDVGRAPVITSFGGTDTASLSLIETQSNGFTVSATEDALNYNGATFSIVGGVDA